MKKQEKTIEEIKICPHFTRTNEIPQGVWFDYSPIYGWNYTQIGWKISYEKPIKNSEEYSKKQERLLS